MSARCPFAGCVISGGQLHPSLTTQGDTWPRRLLMPANHRLVIRSRRDTHAGGAPRQHPGSDPRPSALLSCLHSDCYVCDFDVANARTMSLCRAFDAWLPGPSKPLGEAITWPRAVVHTCQPSRGQSPPPDQASPSGTDQDCGRDRRLLLLRVRPSGNGIGHHHVRARRHMP